MLNFVSESKYRAETISIIVSFSDLLPSGTTIIGAPVITVTLDTGLDPNPSNILYQGVTITNGNTIEQRFRLGVIGCIYQINFSVTNNAGQTFDKDSYLAILPDDNNAVPAWLPLWETTQLYPYQQLESANSFVYWNSGTLRQQVYDFGPEGDKSFILWVGGTLVTFGISYNNPHEDIKGFTQWISGTLTPVGIIYNNPHEDLKAGVAWISGTLIGAGLFYANPHEDLKGNILWIGGTLV